MAEQVGFEVGITQAHCCHCEYTTPLNTPKWIMWLHLCKHPRALWEVLN